MFGCFFEGEFTQPLFVVPRLKIGINKKKKVLLNPVSAYGGRLYVDGVLDLKAVLYSGQIISKNNLSKVVFSAITCRNQTALAY